MERVAVRPVEPVTRRSGRGDQMSADDAFAALISKNAPKRIFARVLEAIMSRGRAQVVARRRSLRSTRDELAALLQRLNVPST